MYLPELGWVIDGVDFGVEIGGVEISGGRIVYVSYFFGTDKVVKTD